MEIEGLGPAYFAFPGPLRDLLVGAILAGTKTSTSCLVSDYEQEGEALPEVGERSVVYDSDDQPVAVIETTAVRVVRVGDVDLQHAIDEGEGYESVAAWRAGHEEFWHSIPGGETVSDDTLMVAERFRLVGAIPRGDAEPAPESPDARPRGAVHPHVAAGAGIERS